MTQYGNGQRVRVFNASDIDNMEQRIRANFINSLSGFKSANLIGTKGLDSVDNLAIVSSVFHIGAHPPLLGMIMRPHTVVRDTLQNIKDTGVYTINHVCTDIAAAAHQTSARYPSEESEFLHTELTPLASQAVNAPYVKESKIALAMQVQDIQLIAINKTEMVIGQVVEVVMQDNYVADDGYVDIESAQTVAVSGLDAYHTTQSIDRFSYAKPDERPRSIKK
jgi:flavin reductase (DIM6/NTAB) family NADH-FMN oxidoreductase RutF